MLCYPRSHSGALPGPPSEATFRASRERIVRARLMDDGTVVEVLPDGTTIVVFGDSQAAGSLTAGAIA